MSEETKKWGDEIVSFLNKMSAEIEGPHRRFKYFKLLALLAKHEASHAEKLLELMENRNEEE